MYVVEDGIVMPNKKAAIDRGRAMVAAGRPRREVAIEIYGECYVVTNVQSSTYQRRLRDLVGRLA